MKTYRCPACMETTQAEVELDEVPKCPTCGIPMEAVEE